MKVSELTSNFLAEYIHVEPDDPMVQQMKTAAVAYVKSFTGLTDKEIDAIDEMWIAVACLVSDMYDNRSMVIKEEGMNRTAATIMMMHATNYL